MGQDRSPRQYPTKKVDEENPEQERVVVMAKKKRKVLKKRQSSSPGIPKYGKLPTLGDLKVPKEGLLDPRLRSDIGNVPGLALSR